ncbi:hypothetical protein LTR37_001113 [Vermiconidia calcicola]|uniref:Uncharacterized protein n=1 Tax=Vermiconidia calcicola TaxID=1690605 RepID=A0ACC3NX82_9PEZI|nr:hypothetical protein LTR37_001113 [Vermiconidia calcicola]
MEETTFTPPISNVTSPEQRPSSPSPSVSPSLALDAVPLLDRSVSSPSTCSVSTPSTRSRQSRVSDGGGTINKRRGYMRPQGTAFADSARNRDSVMSLGSIAHMQYYFARTGLLDGKGAQLAKDKERKKSTNGDKENVEPAFRSGSFLDGLAISSLSLNDGALSCPASESGQDVSVVESPSELSQNGEPWSFSEPPMLPPTVSTYKQKPSYTEPLPDMPVLRRELKEALQDACKVLEETQKNDNNDQSSSEEGNGYYEIQGLHILDIITLAIRAAKNYYTAHTNPHKLYALRSEKRIRADLYNVLDVLKRMASRNFRGGIRVNELTEILLWIESIDKMLKREDQLELEEAAEREAMVWREGDWTGREREREWLFLKSFDSNDVPLPQWPEPTAEHSLPTDFLKALQDGQRLVKLHNALIDRSKGKFGEIKKWHTDVAKPYRMAENLRFWVKASELRWEIKLTVTVSDVVNSKGEEAWRQFDEAIFKWCWGVRAQLIEEWRQEKANEKRKPPELKIELPVEGSAPVEADGEAAVEWSTEANKTTDGETNEAAEPVGNQDSAKGAPANANLEAEIL